MSDNNQNSEQGQQFQSGVLYVSAQKVGRVTSQSTFVIKDETGGTGVAALNSEVLAAFFSQQPSTTIIKADTVGSVACSSTANVDIMQPQEIIPIGEAPPSYFPSAEKEIPPAKQAQDSAQAGPSGIQSQTPHTITVTNRLLTERLFHLCCFCCKGDS